MLKDAHNLYIKFKLFYPVFIGSILAIVLVSAILVEKSKREIYQQAENNMKLEVLLIRSMFERERELKLEKVKTDLKIARKLFYLKPIEFSEEMLSVEAKNQFTNKHITEQIPTMLWAGKPVYHSKDFTSETFKLFGGTTTIFQKIDSGYLRIATNVQTKTGNPAVNTYIPNSSPVAQKVRTGATYFGRAFVVNDWYITAYEPIFHADTLAGLLYVGDKEKDLKRLEKILQGVVLGESGFIFVTDKQGNLIIEPESGTKSQTAKAFVNQIQKTNSGSIQVDGGTPKTEYLLTWVDYPEFEFHIAALIPARELTHLPVRNIVITAIYFALLISILFIILVLFTTTQRVHRLLNAIRLSNLKLRTTKDALRQSEHNFRTLFNNSSDEMLVSDMQGNILEMNEKACVTLEYERDQLLTMNLLELKPEKRARQFLENRKKLQHMGSLIYDSEYLTRTGKLIPVEINSRLLDFNHQQAILSISRNLKLRNELERKVLSAVIQTEERERERFSKDMHDGLGPLLSTVKLYVGEIANNENPTHEKELYIKQVNDIIDEAVTSTREISNNLMPRVIHEYGVVKAIQAFCNKINLTNRIKIEFNTTGVDQNMDMNIQLILFRVISELINNTIKHAQASLISIHIEVKGDKIRLEFNDNGIGFNTEKIMGDKKTGIGLKSIISRIKSINGTCNFSSEEGKGFRIIIEI